MNAVLLAGGFGSRLKPLTDSVPKPMLPVANAPMLDYAVSHLKAVGISDVVFTLGYYPEQVKVWADAYTSVHTHYLVEDVPLGTAGGVRAAQNMLDDTFIVVSGDALENVDYAAMLRSHVRSGKAATMAVTSVPDPRAFGLVKYRKDGTVTQFTEKPEDARESGIVNCGIYILDRSVLSLIPQNVRFDFSRDLFPVLVEREELNAYYHDGFWSDVGSPVSYYEANFRMMQGGFYPFARNGLRTVSRKLGSETPTLAAYSALCTGRFSGCVIGDGAAVASDAHIQNCVVLPNVTVRGYHYGEILGNGFAVFAAPELVRGRHDSTEIYKNFS